MRFPFFYAAPLLAIIGGPASAAPDSVSLERGVFKMGSPTHYREEGLVRDVTVSPFLISKTEVTNDEFAEFVAATGYVTTAERGLDPAEHAGWPEDLLKPGSMVFSPPR